MSPREPNYVADASLLLANIVDNADDAIISKTLDGTITTWNRAAERIFGYQADEVIGGPISIIIPPERGDQEIEILRRIGRGERIDRFETVRIRKDGGRVEVSLTISPLVKDGRVLGALKIARDITEEKRVLRELEHQTMRLKTTLASIGDAVIVTDPKAAVSFMNRVAEDLTGWKLTEALGQPLEAVFNIVNETTRRRAENPATRALREGVVVGLANHTVLISRAGTEFAIDDTAAPIRADSEDLSGAVLVFRDVSGARADANFRARLAAIVQSSDDAIISKDLTGRITTWNEAAVRLFGYTAEEAIGRPISIIIPPDRLHEETMILATIRSGKRVEHFETVRLAKNRRKIDVSLSISPIHDLEGHVIGASKIARDITAQKKTELELLEARERIDSYSRRLEDMVKERTAELHAINRELEAFSYTAAHDLRSPLRTMRATLGILQEEVGSQLRPEHHDLLHRLAGSAERMSKLLEALLTLSRIGKQDLRRSRVSLDDLVRQAVDELRPEADGRQVRWNIAPLPTLDCDPAMMQQAVHNLLHNALKYTRDRQPATIEVGQTIVERQPAIFVRDNGVGFNPEQADKLFTPFHRLHPEQQFEGTGVGLTTVERIIRRHGGRIWAEGQPGQGAVFYFTLPEILP